MEAEVDSLIKVLLAYAKNPTKEGSKNCRRMISEIEERAAESQRLKDFLTNAYEMTARPYLKAKTDIRKLVRAFSESGL